MLIGSGCVKNFIMKEYHHRNHGMNCFHVGYFVQSQFQSQYHFLLSVTTLIKFKSIKKRMLESLPRSETSLWI